MKKNFLLLVALVASVFTTANAQVEYGNVTTPLTGAKTWDFANFPGLEDWMIQEGVRKKPRAMCPGLKIVVIVALGTESWIESCLGGLWSPTVVVGILRDIGVANQRPVHTLGIEHTRILACALEHHVHFLHCYSWLLFVFVGKVNEKTE